MREGSLLASKKSKKKAVPEDLQVISGADMLASSASSDAADDLSRAQSVEYYSKERKRRGRRKAARVFLGVLLGALLLGAGVVWAYINNINDRLHANVTDELRTSLLTDDGGVPGDPFYMLLLGIDKDDGRAHSSEYGAEDYNYRTDTIIIARIDPRNVKVTLVSIHRDTLVDLGYNGKDKINAAFSIGGAPYIIDVVEEFADIPISHYAEVDMDRFARIVDTIGGVEVDLPVDVYDPTYTGIDLKAGVQTLDGHTAALLCRCRHGYDAYGDGDVFRAANQRMVIGAIIRKVLTLDPVTMANTISTMADSVTTDFSVGEILTLANQFRTLNVDEDIMTGMEPTNSMYVNETWYEICSVEAWQTMMTRVDQGLSPWSDESQDLTAGIAGSVGSISSAADEAAAAAEAGESHPDVEPEFSGTVQVLNGAGIDGLATRISASLSNWGFYTYSGDAGRWDYAQTLIIYNGEDHLAQAQAVNEALGGEMRVMANDGSYYTDADVLVILGTDAAY